MTCLYCQSETPRHTNCCHQCIHKVFEGVKPPRRHKYNAQRCEADGYKFHSKKERDRYLELKILEQAGEISDLELQPRYWLEVNGETIGMYVGDFRYVENGKVIVEDAKGFVTRVYRMKKRLMKAVHGIEIRET